MFQGIGLNRNAFFLRQLFDMGKRRIFFMPHANQNFPGHAAQQNARRFSYARLNKINVGHRKMPRNFSCFFYSQAFRRLFFHGIFHGKLFFDRLYKSIGQIRIRKLPIVHGPVKFTFPNDVFSIKRSADQTGNGSV